MSGSHYMRAAKIARLLDISERTVRRWIATEELPSVKIGGARLVAKADLERLLSADWNPDDEDE
jgi:excisionase family DNA binding protein